MTYGWVLGDRSLRERSGFILAEFRTNIRLLQSSASLDTSRKCYPMPIVKINRAIKRLRPGDVLEIIATDPGTQTDIPAWCERTGNELVESQSDGNHYRYLVRKAQ